MSYQPLLLRLPKRASLIASVQIADRAGIANFHMSINPSWHGQWNERPLPKGAFVFGFVVISSEVDSLLQQRCC